MEIGKCSGFKKKRNWKEDDGDTICHIAVSANGTGLLPDTPIGHRPISRFTELAEVLCPVEEGGILKGSIYKTK
ncbi:hypothetical protein FJZ33_11270 [Candidatus Poribacteria bacterium]|nr:hypothetical protein [Candidatus Poribacteria bacterium]